MNADDLAAKVIAAIQGNPEAVKQISDALASGDASAIRGSIQQYAGIEITDEEAQEIVAQVKADPSRPAAFNT